MGLVALTVAASATAALEQPPMNVVVPLAVLLVVVAGLALDAYGGALAGLAGAAGIVGVRQLTGHWEDADFQSALVETVALVLSGTVAGLAGSVLRARDVPVSVGVEAAFGSLGLVPWEVAEERLQEELERAVAHQRPLTLAVFGSVFNSEDLDEKAREAALRAVARIVENRASESDVPFALSADRVGLILPETSQAQAWERVGSVLDALEEATFVAGRVRTRIPVHDVVDSAVGIVEVGPQFTSAEQVMEAALDRLQAGRERAVDP